MMRNFQSKLLRGSLNCFFLVERHFKLSLWHYRILTVLPCFLSIKDWDICISKRSLMKDYGYTFHFKGKHFTLQEHSLQHEFITIQTVTFTQDWHTIWQNVTFKYVVKDTQQVILLSPSHFSFIMHQKFVDTNQRKQKWHSGMKAVD